MKKVFLFLATTLLLSACHQSGKPETDHPQISHKDSVALHLALMPTVDCLPFYYAKEQGIFDSLNVPVEIKSYMAQMDCDTAFCRKHADVAYTDLIRAALLQSKDTALYIFMQTDGSHELITAFSKRIKSPKQLKEKMVGIARHSVTDFLSTEIVQKAQITPEELYKPQINDISLRAAMVQNATIDAAFLPDPYATQARLQKNRSIYSTRKEGIHLMGMMVSRQALNDPQKAKWLSALVKGYNMAVQELKKKSKQHAACRLFTAFGIREQVLDSLQLPQYKKASVPDPQQIQKAIEWLKNQNLIKTNYQGDTLVNSSLTK